MDKLYIYVCSAYRREEDNYQKAIRFGQYVVRKGGIPIIPHTMLHGVLDDSIPEQRLIGLNVGKKLIKLCDAVWVFGKAEGSEGMLSEISIAKDEGIPITYVNITDVWGADEKTIALKKCLTRFEETYLSVNRIVADDMIYYLDAGIEPELICESINIAARKNARWPYSKAILQRCFENKIFSLSEFRERQNKKRAASGNFAAYDLEAFEDMLNKDE